MLIEKHVNCRGKALENKTNQKKVKFTVLLQIIYQGVLETRRGPP